MLQGLSMGEPLGPSLSSLTDSEVFGASLFMPLAGVGCGGAGGSGAPSSSAKGSTGPCSLVLAAAAAAFLFVPLPDLVRCGVAGVEGGGDSGGGAGGRTPCMLCAGVGIGMCVVLAMDGGGRKVVLAIDWLSPGSCGMFSSG